MKAKRDKKKDTLEQIMKLAEHPAWKEFVELSKLKEEEKKQQQDIKVMKWREKHNPSRYEFELKGVFFEDDLVVSISAEKITMQNRKKAFTETSEGDEIYIRFDAGNQFDKNAIGVYTKAGFLLGYLPKSQKSIIKILNSFEKEIMGTVIKKVSESKKKGVTIEFHA